MIIITKKQVFSNNLDDQRWIITKTLSGTEVARTEMNSHEQAVSYANRFSEIYGKVLDLTASDK